MQFQARSPVSPSMHEADAPRDASVGKIRSVRGSVVEAEFSEQLPELHHQLRAGDNQQIVIEVLAHVDDRTVRGVLQPPKNLGLLRPPDLSATAFTPGLAAGARAKALAD